jgi:hypothetical protein
MAATVISGVAEHDNADRSRWRSCPELGGTSLTTSREWPGSCSRRRKGIRSGCCRRRWKIEECRCSAHRGKQGRGGGRERQRRWPVKGNGGEDGAACLSNGDDGGGGSDRGGATTRGRRQLDGFISRTEIDVMTCGGQVGDDTHRQARRRSQPMTGGPMAGYFQTQNRL